MMKMIKIDSRSLEVLLFSISTFNGQVPQRRRRTRVREGLGKDKSDIKMYSNSNPRSPL